MCSHVACNILVAPIFVPHEGNTAPSFGIQKDHGNLLIIKKAFNLCGF